MPTHPVMTEGVRWGAAIMSEANFHRSRENAHVPAETEIGANSLVARIARVADTNAEAAAVAGNTGNGAITLASPALSTKAKDGVYSIVCIEPASDGGTFDVRDPSGKSIGTAKVGVAFNKEIKFTIADGGTDFAAGDQFTVTVSAEGADYDVVPYNPAGTNGSEEPYGYSPYPVTTGEGQTKQTALLVRECELNGNCIAWPAGITAAQKQNAIDALTARQIIVRY